MVQRQNIRNCLVQILGLVQQCLPMEGGYILIKVDSEEIQISCSSTDCRRIVPQDIVEVSCSLGGNGPNLLVTTGIPRNEKYRNTFDLTRSQSVLPNPKHFCLRTFVSSSTIPSLYR
jgi:hypothetical protein